MKKITYIRTLAALAAAGLVLTGCAGKDSSVTETETTETREKETETQPDRSIYDDDTLTIGVSDSVMGMGFGKLAGDADESATTCKYVFEPITVTSSDYQADVASGRYDLVTVSPNMAAMMYNSSKYDISVVGVINVGGTCIIETGDSIHSVADLKGRTIYGLGEGTITEYNLRCLLTEAGLDYKNDVSFHWCEDISEMAAYMSTDEEGAFLIQEPGANSIINGMEGTRIALDLNEIYKESHDGEDMVSGVIIAQNYLLENHPDMVSDFLEEYAASIQHAIDNPKEASEYLAGEELQNASESYIADSGITLITGEEMKTLLSDYLTMLYGQNQVLIGMYLPEDDFYYTGK